MGQTPQDDIQQAIHAHFHDILALLLTLLGNAPSKRFWTRRWQGIISFHLILAHKPLGIGSQATSR
ncbi:hypothetical protein K492DRAFT_176364 [Lichtheimia hyalospora FSU 10163]|nr:hypothetical protein K492DRAFT_176364 [Lichtheimia hyalospora FSU 10163]